MTTLQPHLHPDGAAGPMPELSLHGPKTLFEARARNDTLYCLPFHLHLHTHTRAVLFSSENLDDKLLLFAAEQLYWSRSFRIPFE